MFDIWLIYIPLHISIFKDHHQIVYEYISVITELSTTVLQFNNFSFVFTNLLTPLTWLAWIVFSSFLIISYLFFFLDPVVKIQVQGQNFCNTNWV
jgi:hypothetical protein